MRILVFSLTFDPHIGGAEIALREIIERLPHITFDIITLRFDERLPEKETIGDNLTVHRIGFTKKHPSIEDTYKLPLTINKYLFPFIAVRKADELLRENEYDFTWSIMASFAGYAGYRFKKKYPELPSLLTIQEGDHFSRRQGILSPLFRNIFASADRIQAISGFLEDWSKKMGAQCPIVVIPNGVDTAIFAKSYSVHELAPIKRQLTRKVVLKNAVDTTLQKDDAFVVTVSRLVQKNGVGDLIAAMQYLPPNIRLAVVGSGPGLTGLVSKTAEFGLNDRITFVGSVPYVDVPKYLKISSVFVRPSISEGFGNSFIEAMAAGVPVVATPVGGITDFVFDPEHNPGRQPTGLFCEPGNPKSIAQKISTLLDNPDLAKRIVENARRLAIGEYDWHHIARRMEREAFPIAASNQKRI